MATRFDELQQAEPTASRKRPASSPGPLIVATDGTTAADSALRMTRAVATRWDRDVVVVSVQVPIPMAAPEMQMALPPTVDAERRDTLRTQVQDQLERTGIDEEWPIEIASGDPAATIVKLAVRLRSPLVVMGLGEHGLFDRLLGDETVLRVLRLGTVPVLAVAPGAEDLPRRVLASTDFTASSVRAASLAAGFMAPEGSLTLAHVLPGDVDPANWMSGNAAYHGTMGRAFDLAIARIGAKSPRTVDRGVLAGDPATQLLTLAEKVRPDLIVAGSHGHGFLTRLRLGSVSQKLVRAARCCVLVAPPEDAPNFLDEMPAATTRFASYEWSERLEEFTRRNAGHRATLEVIDPELGAQIEEKGYPFVGASFDPRDGRVHIMLGDAELRGRHLTHSIDGISAVQVLRDRAGTDMLLRVAHGQGQTILTLER